MNLRFAWMLIAISAACTLAVEAAARTWYVNQDGSVEFTSILDALEVATEGDSIRIGPGWYSDAAEITVDFWGSVTACAPVTVSSLTLIGEGKGATIVGPESPVDQGSTVGIATGAPSSILHIESLTVANTEWGAMLSGNARLVRVEFLHLEFGGLSAIGPGELTILDSSIDTEGFWGLDAVQYTSVLLDGCTLSGAVGVSSCEDVRIVGVRSEGRVNGVSATNSNVAMSDCFVRGTRTGVIWSSNGDDNRLVVSDSHVEGGEQALWAAPYGHVEFLRNRIVSDGTSIELINVSDVQFSENTITSGSGRVVWLDGYSDAGGVRLDFRNNWWGTTDVDVIQASIVDANHPDYDDDPNMNGYVDFLPFLGQSVPTSRESVGGLKAKFGRE